VRRCFNTDGGWGAFGDHQLAFPSQGTPSARHTFASSRHMRPSFAWSYHPRG